MSTPQERVMAERQKVYADYEKLHEFIRKPENATIVGEGQWTLMREQYEIMEDYIRVLDARLTLFSKNNKS